MQTDWQEQMRNYVDSVEKIEQYINLSHSERKALEKLNTTWADGRCF